MDNILEKIIAQALDEKDSDGSVKTTTVALHLSQMREWGTRGGNVQIKPIQDFNGIRKDYVFQLLKENAIKQRLESAMDSLVARGEVLWVAAPSQEYDSGFIIDYFVGGKHNPNPDYVIFYDDNDKNKVECACILTEIELNKPNLYSDNPGAFLTNNSIGSPQIKYQLTFIDREIYLRFTLDQKPHNLKAFYYLYSAYRKEDNGFYGSSMIAATKPEEFPNPFAPDFPFQICKNKYRKLNEPGIDDFHPIKDNIEEHNGLLLDAGSNLSIFYTPTLVTSRDGSAVVDEIERVQESSLIKNSWAGQQGFKSAFGNQKPNYRMPRIIGNVKDGERFGYIQAPDAVSGDQNRYIRELRELIHWSLGGVDPLGISSSATFGEIKSLFGRIENTSMKKAESLLGEKGLCNLVSKILLAKERECKMAITQFLITQFLQGVDMVSEVMQSQLTDDEFRSLYFYITQEIGISLPGLPPLGQRDCAWRYTKDVFQRTTREMLDASIVYRNEREDGISQEIALSKLYPNMRDDEIRNSMSGFSPRVVTQALEGIGASLQLYTQFMQLPSPEDPKVPWAVTLGLSQLVEQGILTLQKEISYNSPEFKEEVDLDEINSVLNRTLEQLRNVRTTTESVPTANAANAASGRFRSGN